MIKKIVRHGCGRAITLPRAILEAIGLDPDGVVELTIDRNRIILSAPNLREWGKPDHKDDHLLDNAEVTRAH